MQQISAPARPGALRSLLIASLLSLAAIAPTFAAGTLDKAKDSGKLTLGYANNARPYAYADASGKAAGYGVAVCNQVADAVKSELKLAALATEYVALAPDEAFRAVDQGKVDLLCGVVPTLQRRALVDFSVPIMLSGTGVAVRTDALPRLVQALTGEDADTGPLWRGSLEQAPQRVRVAAVGGTALEKALSDRLKQRRIVAEVVAAKDPADGMRLLAAGDVNAFVGDRAQLLDAGQAIKSDVVVLERLFRRDVVALALRRNDDAFRLVVDRALSRLYRSGEILKLYASHFGAPNANVLEFFQLVALPD